jgi:glycosyltransferase involved in cell wall biosynthesis
MISVIVPVRNGMPWLEAQLRAIIDQKCDSPWELVVADNGSTDGSAELVEKFKAEGVPVVTVDASSVAGPGATRNVGAKTAEGDLLAFCDADDIVNPGWLQACVDELANADGAGGVTDFWSLNGIPAPNPPTPSVPPAKRQFGFLDAGLSSNLAVKKPVFEVLGGFEESMFTGEDTDFCWRLQNQGYKFVISPGMVVSRRDRSGTGQVFRRFVAYGRSGPVLYKRHKNEGLKRESANALRAWCWLFISVPKLGRPDFRTRWVSVAGWRVGRLAASLKQRVFFP